MKHIAIRIALLALAFSSAAALATEAGTVNIGGNLAQRDCDWCHGSRGRGFSTAPQLAGQRRQYLQNQLVGFQSHLRNGLVSRQYMWGAAARLDPQKDRALAAYFSALTAAAASDGDKELATAGARIYRVGIPAANIPSCVPCHGLAAEGGGGIPRLGGQSYNYLKRRLKEWVNGYDAATAPPMPEIAGKLSSGEIEALASYLSFVK